jgi:hypothetical protein
MVNLRLLHVCLQESKEFICTLTHILSCMRTRACNLCLGFCGLGRVICGQFGSEVDGKSGGFWNSGQGEILDNANMCVFCLEDMGELPE